MSTGQFEYGGVPGCCVDPVCGYQIRWYKCGINFGMKSMSMMVHSKEIDLDLFHEVVAF